MIDIKEIEREIDLEIIAYEYAEQECDELIEFNYEFISSGNLIDDRLIVWFVDKYKELRFAIKIKNKLLIGNSPLYSLSHLIDDNKTSVDELIKYINKAIESNYAFGWGYDKSSDFIEYKQKTNFADRLFTNLSDDSKDKIQKLIDEVNK